MLNLTSPAELQDPTLLSLFDEDGFIINPDLWTKEMAQQLADDADVGELKKPHWDIIVFLRDRYLRLGAIPPTRRICREFGYEKDAVRGLFGGCLQLWQIAGLPYPGEEAKSYMD
ncbi:MAG: Sulfurtransferase [uncultured Thiotrichaceae bacterium]|uniref:Sulfurtransferase n=1 Tax=uncultured Thiotrichaceae bacterium TaxID=298394 RepID=A0A6S6TUD8_9GAMM|nr:MAG: Sulfurtransferase [uncultured Thiotrichaceae bacterium]